MPLLDDSQVQELLLLVTQHRCCESCGLHTAMDYCRTCDEFYWLHQEGCPMFANHRGHRLTIFPHVEVR